VESFWENAKCDLNVDESIGDEFLLIPGSMAGSR